MQCKNKNRLSVTAVVVLTAFFMLGSERRTWAASSCPNPRTSQDVLECVLKNSPTAERSQLVIEASKASEDAAGRFSNPSLSLQSGFIRPSGQRGSDHQLSLTQPIDLGGKRTSRVNEAEALTGQHRAELEGTRANLIIATLAKLNRLRQLGLEFEALTETTRTLTKLISLFKSRPTLTPEQDTSLILFKAAQNDLELKRISLDDESRVIHQFFALSAGLSMEDLRPALPKTSPDWVSITPSKELSSFTKKRADAELNLAIAELSSANAASWPEIAIGPYAQFQSDGTNKNNLYGVVLSLELPVLSLNRGGRAAAQKGILVAEKNKEILKKEEASEQDLLLESYTKSVEALGKLPTVKSQEKEHIRLEKLFIRGVVPSSLVIESHRQMWELMRSKHEREEKALEALWKIKALQGKILEASL